MRAALAACLLAACSATPRGQVSVHVNTPPSDEAFVVFQDPDGSSRAHRPDEHGDTIGELAPGGSVMFVRGTTEHTISVYTDVEPGSVIEFGSPPSGGPAPERPFVLLKLDAELPADTDVLEFSSACGNGEVRPGEMIALDATCHSTDLIVIPCHRRQRPGLSLRISEPGFCDEESVYVEIPAQPVSAGGNISIGASDWVPLPETTIRIAGGDGVVAATALITTTWGLEVSADIDASTLVARIPMRGPATVSARLTRSGGPSQEVWAHVPEGGSLLDLGRVLTPWVTRQPDAWTADDLGGALVADALVMTYQSGPNTLRVYRSPETAGDYALPELPRSIAPLIVDDASLVTSARLVRSVGTSVAPQRFADMIENGADLRATTYSMTLFP